MLRPILFKTSVLNLYTTLAACFRRIRSQRYKAEIEVEGYLNGSKAEPSERGEQVELLRARIKKNPDNSNWHVFDIGDILDRTKIVHQHLLDAYNKATRKAKQGVPI